MSSLRLFRCPKCDHTERTRGHEVWHPCPKRPSKTGRPQMVEMIEENE